MYYASNTIIISNWGSPGKLRAEFTFSHNLLCNSSVGQTTQTAKHTATTIEAIFNFSTLSLRCLPNPSSLRTKLMHRKLPPNQIQSSLPVRVSKYGQQNSLALRAIRHTSNSRRTTMHSNSEQEQQLILFFSDLLALDSRKQHLLYSIKSTFSTARKYVREEKNI